jgi:PAS domain S-box-containing protein
MRDEERPLFPKGLSSQLATNAFLASLVESSDDAIIGKTLEGIVTSWNSGAEKIFGFKRAEIIGKPITAIIPSDRLAEEVDILDRIVRGETVSHFETKRLRKDGALIDVSVTISPIRDDKGMIAGASKIARDISPIKARQAEIERLSRLYSALCGINQVIIRAPTREQLFNRTCTILCESGGFKTAWIGWYFPETREIRPVASHGDTHGYLEHFTIPIDSAIEANGPSGRAFRECRKVICNSTLTDPSTKPWWDAMKRNDLRSSAAFPISIENVATGLLTVYASEEGFFRDKEIALLEETASDISLGLENIARQKKISEQAHFLDSAQEGIYVTDLDNRITYWNKGAETIFGWSAEEMMGTKTTDRLYEDVSGFTVLSRETLEKGSLSAEIRKRTKSGKILSVGTHATVIRDEQGAPKSILVINIDVTAQRSLEAQFLRAQRLESIGALAGGIAHDMNNLLAPIMMGVDLLRAASLSSQQRNIVEIIDRSAHRGTELVKQVLAFARGSEGSKIALNVGPILKEVRAIVENTFPKNITVSTDIGRDLWLVVAQPTQVNQVLMNLSVNARDAMPDGGRLVLAAKNLVVQSDAAHGDSKVAAGKYVSIEVTDTGSGIEPTVLEHIFEPFFTTKDPGKGTGLGLSTVKGIVQGAGGYLDVRSEVGKGSTFRILMPAQEATVQSAPPEQRAPMPRGHGELVLVVDDEVSILQIARQTLTSYGYRVLTAENGAHAIGIFAAEQGNVAAIFTDLVMPIMDGRSLIAAARRINPQVVIVAATGAEKTANLAEVERLGVSCILSKPYSAEEILRSLRKALDASESTADPLI